jgi:sugar lactone lactonase YvrE
MRWMRPPIKSLRNVLGFYVDRKNGWLWALDMGFVAGETESPVGAQKLMVLDLKSGSTIKSIPLDGVADRKASFLNDVVVDEKRRVAYISDSGNPQRAGQSGRAYCGRFRHRDGPARTRRRPGPAN